MYICTPERRASTYFLPTGNQSFFPRHAAHESRSSAISIFVLAAISVAVRGKTDARPTPLARYGRGRYILEDCFLSSGSHIRHAKSLEEA